MAGMMNLQIGLQYTPALQVDLLSIEQLHLRVRDWNESKCPGACAAPISTGSAHDTAEAACSSAYLSANPHAWSCAVPLHGAV